MTLALVLDHLKQTSALQQVAGIIGWDQETMMPPAGAGQRAVQSGAMAAVIHRRHADSQLRDWLEAIDDNSLSGTDRCNIREARRAYDRATKIPESLAQAIATAGSEGQGIWIQAREAKDFAQFAPALKQMIDLKREEAACLSADGSDPYDALLDEFEPGMRVTQLAPMLEDLRPRLTAIRGQIDERAPVPTISGDFGVDQQMKLGRQIAGQLGYDFNAGRLDTVTHPFCSGIGGDVRITTRVNVQDPLECLYSIIHEVGHALYAQGAPDVYAPAGDYCSMGIHESQSRFWENQICRSEAFMEFLFPIMRDCFGEFGCRSPRELYQAVNAVETGFIRTEADEVHYNLHILLRFELERDLIAGRLDVNDLEAAWNDRFHRDFGRAVPDPSAGVLQDVHWSFGAFGYFPTYSLGNIYAACLDAAMIRDLPDRSAHVARGDMAAILSWLREKIHQHGRVLTAPDLIRQATAKAPDSGLLANYLELKFSDLYSG